MFQDVVKIKFPFQKKTWGRMSDGRAVDSVVALFSMEMRNLLDGDGKSVSIAPHNGSLEKERRKE